MSNDIGTDPAATRDSGDDPAGKEGGAETMTADGVREIFSEMLKKDIAPMITGSTERIVSKAFGDEGFKNTLSTMMQDAAAKAVEQRDAPPPKKPTQTDELRADFESMKKITQELQSERDAAKKEAHEERRHSAIRDALGKHDIRPEAKALLTRAFIAGLEGPSADLTDSGLVVETGDGLTRGFDDHLGEYFKENTWALNNYSARGSGARGNSGSTAGKASAFDLSQVTSREGGGFDEAHRENPDAALETLRNSNAEKAKGIW